MAFDEHFTPHSDLDFKSYARKGDLAGAHHLVRYEWLLRVLPELPGLKFILDAGCGSGYGSYLIAIRLQGLSVHGVDYDPNAIQSAISQYQSPNLSYAVGDLTRWESTIGTKRYDAIISFDSLEHIPHREVMLESMVRHLDPQGFLFLSTPCGAAENRLEPEWPAHRIEFSTASLFDFIHRYFHVVIRPEDKIFPHRDIFKELKQEGIDYLLRFNPIICREPILIPNPYRQ